MEPEWWGEVHEILEAAGREDLIKVIHDHIVEVQKNASWTCASSTKGHLKHAIDEAFAVWLEGRIPGWAEEPVNAGSREGIPEKPKGLGKAEKPKDKREGKDDSGHKKKGKKKGKK